MDPQGPAAHSVAELAWWLFAGGALIFMGVIVLLLVAWRGRGPVSERRWTLGAGAAFPTVVLLVLLGAATWMTRELARRPGQDALVITVVAHLWWWEVRYPDPDGGSEIISANELRLPTGRPVMLGLTSRDVIHSLWVPALAGKVDMLPGRTTQLVVQAERPGVHAGRCAEFCGDQHARMTLPVVAMEPAAFTAWLQSQAGAAPAPGTAVLQRGRDAFGQLRCGACHTVRGESPSAALGPDLTRVGSRLRIGAGVLPAGPRSLQDWVADPQAFKPGANMPSYGHVDAATLADLAAYLDQLR